MSLLLNIKFIFIIFLLSSITCCTTSSLNNSKELKKTTLTVKVVPIVVPFELIDNRIFLDVAVNNKGIFKFILDTAGSYVINLDTAKLLKLNLHDPFPITGVGANEVKAYKTEINSLDISGLKFSTVKALAVPLNGIKNAIGFNHFDGILGSEFFSAHVVKINYTAKTISILPKEVKFEDVGQDFPIVFEGKQPLIELFLDGNKGKFLLDTGDRFSLTIFSPFYEKNKMANHYPNKIKAITGYGIGGPVFGSIFRIDEFGKDQIIWRRFPVRLPAKKDYNNDFSDGTIGNSILKAFNFIIDYDLKRITFIGPSKINYSEYDCSGLWITKSTIGFQVDYVDKNSPSWKAGLRKNDQILEIDGQPVKKLSLIKFRERLSNSSQDSINLKIKSGKRMKKIRLSLSNLI